MMSSLALRLFAQTCTQAHRYQGRYAITILLALLGLSTITAAQTVNLGDDVSRPIPGGGHDYIHGLSETVNPANGSLHIHIDLPVPKGRGFTLPYAITYDSGELYHFTSYLPGVGTLSNNGNSSYAPTNPGWGDTLPRVSYTGLVVPVPGNATYPVLQLCPITESYNFYAPDGTSHMLGLAAIGVGYQQAGPPVTTGCTGLKYGNNFVYGYFKTGGDDQVFAEMDATCDGNYFNIVYPDDCATAQPNFVVEDTSGNVYSFRGPHNLNGGVGSTIMSYYPVQVEDRNGNIITFNTGGPGPFQVVDSVGRTEISEGLISGNSENVVVGGLSYTLGYDNSLQANFAVTSNQVGPPPAPGFTCNFYGSVSFSGGQILRSINLPNGQAYHFDYYSTYGLLKKITYPDGGWVQYTWALSPNVTTLASFDAGDLHTGVESGGCNYQYQTPVVTQRQVGYSATSGTVETQVFTYNPTQWSPSDNRYWTSKSTQVTTTDTIANKTFTTAYSYIPILQPWQPNSDGQVRAQLPVESSVSYYDVCCTTATRQDSKTWVDQFEMSSQVTTWPNSQSSGSTYLWGGGFPQGLLGNWEYDYGQLPPNPSLPPSSSNVGTATRTTAYGYYPILSPCLYLSFQQNPAPPCSQAANALSGYAAVTAQITTYMGNATFSNNTWSGTRIAETDAYYDGNTTFAWPTTSPTTQPITSGTLPAGTHDETNFGSTPGAGTTAAPYVTRGNLTKLTRWSNSGASPTTTFTYDETGQIISRTDPCGNGTCSDMSVGSGATHTTNYYYTDSYTSGTPSGNTNAYLTKTVDPLGHQELFSYDFNSGLLTVLKDQNDINANSPGTTYTYNDPFLRPTQINYPDGGQTEFAYNDASYPPSVAKCELISGAAGTTCSPTAPPSGWKTSVSIMDGLRHVTQSQLVSDPDGADYVDTTYNGAGFVYTQSNPHRSSASPTDGTTTYAYDALGRTLRVIRPDGSEVDTSYSGNCTTVIDEVGAARKSCTDAFGRLIEVDEPGAGAQVETAGSGTVTIGGSEQSVPGTSGSATLSVNGSGYCIYVGGYRYTPTSGSVSLTVYGAQTVTESQNWNGTCDQNGNFTQYPTDSVIASDLASYISNSGAGVSAKSNGTSIQLTAITTGSITNYALSTGWSSTGTNKYVYVSAPASMTDGANAIYDGGSVTVTVNGYSASATYGNGSTSSSIASSLAGTLSALTPVSAPPPNGGSIVTLTATDAGSASNYSLTGSTTWNSQVFSSPSFNITLSGSALTGGSDATLGNNPLVTQYSYDALNNLLCAVQKGTDTTAFTTCAAASATWRPRSFVYDSLSHLTSATNPETGTLTYSYDVNSNVSSAVSPKPGQFGTATTTHNYTYDVENRRIQEAHLNPNDGIQKYSYDGVALTGCPGPSPISISGATNLIHQTSGVCSIRSSSTYSYDPVGRFATEKRSNRGSATKTYSTGYTYWKDGSLYTLTYPSTNVVTYQVGGAGRTTSASDSSNTYVTTPLSGPMYAPHGALVGMTSGSGILTNNTYNNRLQPTLLSAGLNGQNPFFSLCYDFHSGVAINKPPCVFNAYASGNNGNVFQAIDNYDSTRSATFSYDLLNRITQANTVNTTSANCWGEIYSLDSWGNLSNIGGVSSMGSCWHETVTGNPVSNLNQLGGYCYDAAGNLVLNNTCPGGTFTPTYTYDAENRLSSTAGYTYYYDADGGRMEKSSGSSGTMYWTGPSGEYLAETDLTGATINEEYIYFNGKRIARLDSPPGGAAHYYFSDELQSASTITDPSGTVQERYYYYPYGGLVASIGSDTNHYKFTGKERDAESGLDMFGARYYTSAVGRFMTPDWAAKPTAVPYANFGNPQSLNLYSYVNNNPTTTRDPDGHCPPCDDGFWDFAGAAANAYGSDNFLGYGRTDQPTTAGRIGAAVGDFAATVQGGAEALFGGGVEVGGVALDATGVGAVAGVPANIAGAGLMLHGGATAETGFSNLFKSATDPSHKGATTEPTLPSKTVASEDGVTVQHFTRSGDHGPAHLHVEGNGPSTRIGMNGKPLKGDAELSSAQKAVVDNNKGAIRSAVDKIQRWFKFNNQ